MFITVVLAHPYEKSFNAAIFSTIMETLSKNGHAPYAHDLYKERFDPVFSSKELETGESRDPVVVKYQSELIASGGMIFVHPNWWGQMPAILKGYVDRVMRENVAYRFGKNDTGGGVPEGLFTGKKGLIFTTSNTEAGREEAFFGDPLDRIWKKCVFEFCGITDYLRVNFSVIADSTMEERSSWLGKVGEIIDSQFPKGS